MARRNKGRTDPARYQSQASGIVRSAEGTRYAFSGRTLPTEFAQLNVLAVGDSAPPAKKDQTAAPSQAS